MKMLEYLPIEVINNIIEFVGKIRIKNGNCIKQFSENDKRYKMLLNIPLPIKLNNNDYELLFDIGKNGLIGRCITHEMQIHFSSNNLYIGIFIMYKDESTTFKQYIYKKNNGYISRENEYIKM